MATPNPTKVPTALPRFPASIAGTTSADQFFPAASAEAVAAPPTLALDATRSSGAVNPNTGLTRPRVRKSPRWPRYVRAKNPNSAG